MKRIGGLFDRIHTLPELTTAAWRAARGKFERPGVRAFLSAAEERLACVGSELRAGIYRFGPYTSFAIRDPKSRLIRAPSFQDRVVHHALVAATGSTFERGAIERSYACRAGKGHHQALVRASRWARESEAFLKLDVAKYYDSLDHAHLRGLLRRRFREERLLALFDALLASYETEPAHGLPIGALTSQYLGNFALDPLDHWVLEHGGVRYLRYMDDMLFFGSLTRLRELRRQVEERLALIGLRVKHGGVLNRCALGVPWVGFTLYPDRIRLDPRGRRRLRRRLGRLERRALRGEVSTAELQARGAALFAHARWADDVAWRRVVLAVRDDSRVARQSARSCCKESDGGTAEAAFLAAAHDPTSSTRLRGRARSRSSDFHHGPLGLAPMGEALEPLESRHPRRLVEQLGQELPLRDPEQEGAREPEQEPGLPCPLAPRHGGAVTPPDDAPSRALAPWVGDETLGRAPAGSEIPRASRPAEKVPAGAPPLEPA